jgi:acyl-CoA synthetase (AMP-forming)/AMP-acid ligase II
VNLMMLLEMAKSGYPSRTAIGERGDGITYEELYERAGVAAKYIVDAKVSHLAYIGTSSQAFAIAVFGAAWAGVPIIPINFRLSNDQIVGLLDQYEDVLVIADPQVKASLPAGRRVFDRDEWMEVTADGKQGDEWPNDPDRVAVLLYTSGTAAAPKAAILRHRHLLSYVFSSVEFGGADESEAVAVSVPPYHVAGVANLVSNLYAGRRIVFLDAFTPEAWLEAVSRERVTHAMVVPTMLARIVESEALLKSDVSTLRSLSYGGSRIAASTVTHALELFPTTNFVNAYGLTETSSTIAVLGPEDHRSALASDDVHVRARLGSAGRLIPGIEAEIRGPEGTPLQPDEVGELWLRGDQVSGEYLSRESPLDENGWFPTRDRAYFDSDEYLFIEGRADDTIIRGGENVAPAEIEELLMLHPGIAAAAVVGVPDDEWGQRIAAVVVAVDGEPVAVDELKAFVRERLRGSKTPDQIEIWTELPYTDTGKLLRREICARLTTT